MVKTINCPKCGAKIDVTNSLGRKPLNRGVINVYDTLQRHCSVAAASRELGCSRPYIYKEMAKVGVKPAELLKGKRGNENK